MAKILDSAPMLREVIFLLWFFILCWQFLDRMSHTLALVSEDPETIRWSYFLSAKREQTSTVCPLRVKLTKWPGTYF